MSLASCSCSTCGGVSTHPSGPAFAIRQRPVRRARPKVELDQDRAIRILGALRTYVERFSYGKEEIAADVVCLADAIAEAARQ